MEQKERELEVVYIHDVFYKELVNAEIVTLHEFEKKEIFEGCMPIEVMAKRGEDTIRFGPLKPVGFIDPRTGERPYAIVQLRQDNEEGTLFNMVGFQTNLKFGEQKRVFSMIPGLENAEFVRYGVMHRNTFVNAPDVLTENYRIKSIEDRNIYIAGQLSGVEGYVESIASGMAAALDLYLSKKGEKLHFGAKTMIGALGNYIATASPKHFQPMNSNFAITEPLNVTGKMKDKSLKKQMYSDRAIEEIKRIIKEKNL